MHAVVFDNLFQIVVPLTFLAIWALTSLLNREAQPLPPRLGRPQPPVGPGPGPGPGPGGFGPGSAAVATSVSRLEGLNRDAMGRRGPAIMAPAPRPGGRGDDEILIIEETRRPGRSAPLAMANPATRTGTPGGSGTRRASRSRPSPPAAAKRSEPAGSRSLSGALAAPMPLVQPMSRTINLSPLSMPHSPLLGADPRTIASTVAEAVRPSAYAPSAQAGTGFPTVLGLGSAARLRESIVLNEILQRPLALRRRGPFG
jgi:hypothetical protein